MPVRRPPRVGSDGCCFRISGASVRRRLELVAGGRRPRANGDSEVEVGPSFSRKGHRQSLGIASCRPENYKAFEIPFNSENKFGPSTWSG